MSASAVIDTSGLTTCLIGGQEVEGPDSFAVHDPYTGREAGRAPLLSPSQVATALDRAAAGYPAGSRHDRSGLLGRVAARIESEAEAVARLITLESGLSL